MQDNKNKKYRIFYIVISICFAFCIGIVSFIPISKTKVNARSTSFIHTSDYNISVGNFADLTPTYIYGFPYYITTTFNTSFISFVHSGNIYGCEFNYVNTDNGYISSSLNRSETNTLVTYQSNYNFNVRGYCYRFETAVEEYGSIRQSSILLTNVQVNILKEYANLENSFDLFNYMSYSYYLSGENLKLRVQYSNTTNFNNPIMTVYLTFFSQDYPDTFSSETFYCETLRIDRTNYIKTEYIEVEVPTKELSVFEAIANGISTLFEIEIFPNFRLGNIFLIMLGVSFMFLLLHLIMK